jgi:HD-GYP domain-containing protein (c-di-GMP phosphodiesterase class II)
MVTPSAKSGSQFDEKLLELSSQVDAFERYSHAHGLRVAEIADSIAVEYHIAEHDRFVLQQAALLHDIGEMAMNRDYISATRALTDAERHDMQRHTVIGEQDAAKRGLGKGVQLLLRWHHEWWNGGGYPDALAGENIPLTARILRVADAFASMTADRPFRPAVSESDAGQHLIDLAAIEFDPRVVKTFLDGLEEFPR